MDLRKIVPQLVVPPHHPPAGLKSSQCRYTAWATTGSNLAEFGSWSQSGWTLSLSRRYQEQPSRNWRLLYRITPSFIVDASGWYLAALHFSRHIWQRRSITSRCGLPLYYLSPRLFYLCCNFDLLCSLRIPVLFFGLLYFYYIPHSRKLRTSSPLDGDSLQLLVLSRTCRSRSRDTPLRWRLISSGSWTKISACGLCGERRSRVLLIGNASFWCFAFSFLTTTHSQLTLTIHFTPSLLIEDCV